jgi:O-antigen/teichoic acid export membrane protein
VESRPAKDNVIRGHVFRSTASNWIGQAVILGTGFLIAPFVLHRVGASDYGLWILITSLTGYASVLEFGISSAVIKYVSEFRVRGERREMDTLIATALSLYTVLGILAILFGVAIAFLVPHIIKVPADEQGEAAKLVMLAAVGLGISIPATIIVGVLKGLQRFDLLNMLYVINTLLNAGATVAVLLLGWGILGIAAAAIPVTILTQLPGIWLVHRADPDIHLGWRGARRDRVRMVTGFSVKLFIIQIARQLQMRTDEIVIASALPVARVTPYAFGRRLGEIPNTLANQFVTTLMPLASGLHAESDWTRLRAMYVASARLAVAISAPLAAILSVLAPTLLTLWIGPTYAVYWPVVLLISSSSVVALSMYPSGAMLQGMARHNILAVTSILNGVFNLGLSLILVRVMGITGVALGTFVPGVLEGMIVIPYSMRLLGVPWPRLLRDAWIPALVPVIPAAGVLYALQAALQPDNWIVLGLIAAVGGLVYLAVYFLFRATASEREMVWNLLSQAMELVRARSEARRSARGKETI